MQTLRVTYRRPYHQGTCTELREACNEGHLGAQFKKEDLDLLSSVLLVRKFNVSGVAA